jgi:6-pyruvoyltetrahydropterin/6-carboxytetrahydropterin synthase
MFWEVVEMYRIMVEDKFDGAHRLVGYPGKCAELHGHTWRVQLFIAGVKLNEIQILVDFHEVKTILRQVIEELDHKYLNELDAFKGINPTCEVLAKYIYCKIADRLPPTVKLEKVRIWESLNTFAEYEPD